MLVAPGAFPYAFHIRSDWGLLVPEDVTICVYRLLCLCLYVRVIRVGAEADHIVVQVTISGDLAGSL